MKYAVKKVREVSAQIRQAFEELTEGLNQRAKSSADAARNCDTATEHGRIDAAGHKGRKQAYTDVAGLIQFFSASSQKWESWIEVFLVAANELDGYVKRYELRSNSQVAALKSIADSLKTMAEPKE